MGTFVDAFKILRDGIYQPGTKAVGGAEKEFAHAVAPERFTEAAIAEPAALAFARAEINPPTDGKGLGIYGPNLVHPLGKQLSKQLAKASAEQLATAERGVCEALAAGYLAFLSIEADTGIRLDPRSNPERIWTVAVHNFRGEGAKALGLPAHVVSNMETFGCDALVHHLSGAGLLGWRKGAKVRQLGRYYANAGAFMRAAQTDWNMGPKAKLTTTLLSEHWPYERFALG